MTTVYTIGHSNKQLAAFISLLQGAGIRNLVDVRSRPQSRYCPWFNRRSLEAELPAAGIEYHFMGNRLGGLDGNVDFDGGIRAVTALAEASATAVMCSEGPTLKCHRRYMLTPAFQALGVEVVDISQAGELTKAAEQRDTPREMPMF